MPIPMYITDLINLATRATRALETQSTALQQQNATIEAFATLLDEAAQQATPDDLSQGLVCIHHGTRPVTIGWVAPTPGVITTITPIEVSVNYTRYTGEPPAPGGQVFKDKVVRRGDFDVHIATNTITSVRYIDIEDYASERVR